MKYKAGLLSLLFIIIFISGCGAGRTGELTVGTTGQMARYTQIDGEGHPEGFEIDIWNEIGRRMGKTVRFRMGTLTGLWGMLDSGSLDSIANPTAATKEREEKYLFTAPYDYDPYVLVTAESGEPFSDEGIQSFQGRSVCVAAGTNLSLVLDRWNESHGNPVKTGYLDDQSVLLPAVMNGTYDAAFMLRSGAEIAARDLHMDIHIHPSRIPVLPAVFAFRKDGRGRDLSVQVSRILQDMKNDGTLRQMSVKWFGTDLTVPPPEEAVSEKNG